jgi:predicted Zn-dependent protease
MMKLWGAFKSSFQGHVVLVPLCALVAACSVNPATGQSQFAALMPTGQEASIGAQEHEKIMQQYGGVVKDQALTRYVSTVGARVAANTERPDVTYQFFLLDTPTVNAFALPGGYVYVTRGILSIADDEAQLAAVLAHEIGHVTARHSAERYSHGVVTTLGAAILGAALDSQTAAQAAGVGSQLYLSSYSRRQESEADQLGIRYLQRAGYSTSAMAEFLSNLERFSQFEAEEAGASKRASNFNYFSTHPQTADRVAQTQNVAAATGGADGARNRDAYLSAVEGMIFGDSADQGMVRGVTFWHPGMNFTFSVPDGYRIQNGASAVTATDPASGSLIVFDAASSGGVQDPLTFLTQNWMKGEPLNAVERMTIHGKQAATGEFQGVLNKNPVTIRLVAVQWTPQTIFRFQMAIPKGQENRVNPGMIKTAQSLRVMSDDERRTIRPAKIKIVTARAGDSVTSLSQSQPFPTHREQRFRAINGMGTTQNVVAGNRYKTLTD